MEHPRADVMPAQPAQLRAKEWGWNQTGVGVEASL